VLSLNRTLVKTHRTGCRIVMGRCGEYCWRHSFWFTVVGFSVSSGQIVLKARIPPDMFTALTSRIE